MPRYVVLEHDHPTVHWDLMLEDGDVLRTWKLVSPPYAGQDVCATALGNHRAMYLDYEGPVSRNRGHVVRWDAGIFTWKNNTARHKAVYLDGTQLHGEFTLERVAGDDWIARFFPD